MKGGLSVALVLFTISCAKFSPPKPPSLFFAADAGAVIVLIEVPLPLKFEGPSKVTFLSLWLNIPPIFL